MKIYENQNLHVKEFKRLRDISINFEKNDRPLDLVGFSRFKWKWEN